MKLRSRATHRKHRSAEHQPAECRELPRKAENKKRTENFLTDHSGMEQTYETKQIKNIFYFHNKKND